MKMTVLRNMTLSERHYLFEVFAAFFQDKNVWGEEAEISTKMLICRLIRLRGSNRKNTLNLTGVAVTTCSFTSPQQPLLN
jgi:hypothetical protein